MKIAFLFVPAAFALLLVGAPRAAFALAPSDPRTAINAVNTPGTSEATFRIQHPGSYYLEQNLIGEADKVGILVTTSNVRIDLMGFSLRGLPSSVHGIADGGAYSNIVISNGFISDWPRRGISFGQSSNVHVRDVGLSALGFAGIVLGRDCVVERSNVFGAESYGISGGHRLTVVNCKVSGVSGIGSAQGTGILAGQASLVRDSTVTGNGGVGISLNPKSMVLGYTVTDNLAGISGQGGLVADSTVSDNETTGLNLLQSTVRNCEVAGNGSHGIALSLAGSRALGNRIAGNGGDGIWVDGGARIEENDVRSHAQGAGIRAFGTGSFVVKNTLFANSLQISVPNSGNFVGPLVSVNAVNGRNEPWANIHGN